MKNSSKLLLAAVLVLLASLTAYNMALRTEYRKGSYKDPYRDYETRAFTNFSEVAVEGASEGNVEITPGPYQVRVSPQAAPYVRLRQQGRRLVYSLVFPERRHYLGYGPAVVISCPRLAALSTDAVFTEAGRPRAEKRNETGEHRVRVQNFRQDSLRLRQDRASRVELAGNQLGYLAAEAGFSTGSHPVLQLDDTNAIMEANLHLEHQSELLLNTVRVPRLHYQFADSVRLGLPGAALGSLLR